MATPSAGTATLGGDMEQGLLGNAQMSPTVVLRRSVAAGLQKQKYVTSMLLVTMYILSAAFKRESINVGQGLWWEIRAFFIILLTLFLFIGALWNLISFIRKPKERCGVLYCLGIFLASIFFVFLLVPSFVMPYFSSFVPWFTWPVQLVMKMLSGDFEESMKPVWRPILWGVAQTIKFVLPTLKSRTLRLNYQQMIAQFLPSVRTSSGACCFNFFLFFLLGWTPMFHLVPWLYTSPVAQVWLVYIKECGEAFYFWLSAGNEVPPVHMWLCAVCFVPYVLIVVCGPTPAVPEMFGVPFDTDKFMKDVMHKGGFQATLEQPNPVAQLVRSVTSSIVSADSKDLESKRGQMKTKCIAKHGKPASMYWLGPIDRRSILKSSLQSLRSASTPQLLSPGFRTRFKDEGGLDAGGLTRDWFDSVAQALVDGSTTEPEPGQAANSSLMAQTTDQTLLPRPSGYTEQKLYTGSGNEVQKEAEAAPQAIKERWYDLATVGRFVAVAVLQGRPLPLAFGSVLMKFICDQIITYRDVRQLDPDFFNYRVKKVLEPDGIRTMNAALGEPLTFVSAATDLVPDPVPLIPGGQKKEVTEENKLEYIDKLSEARLCNGRRRELLFFIEGFHEVIPLEVLKEVSLTPGELSVLISGVQTYDVAQWKANAEANNGEEVVDYFWQVLTDFSEEKRAKVLQFATGSSRLPPGGFANLKPKFKVVVTGTNTDHLPIAHTCANHIDLPRYTSKGDLESKLVTAIETCGGFGFM
mmetsp:Transcript_158295/g.303754  ORF Transcript_158295/g.303754 Transcript_158295/m.303754 type:complete len:751 (-) Transcript_158295:55-2307(-)